MADNTNPSVVNDQSGSNYKLSDTGGLFKTDVDYISDLKKSLENPPSQLLPTDQYFPSGNRSIRVGQVSNKTLGSVPIFAAGRGLLPVGMIEAKKRAEAEKALQRYAFFGPENNEILKQNIELANPWAQDEFNVKLQGELNNMLDSYAQELGGDYSKARLAMKYDPSFRSMLNQYQTFARGYNALYPQAAQVLQDYSSGKYVQQEDLDMATQFVKNFDNLGSKSIQDLNKFVNRFHSYMSVKDRAVLAAKNMGDRITSYINELPNLSTDAESVLETVSVKNMFTDKELSDMTDADLAGTVFENDPTAKKNYMTQLKFALDQETKRQIASVRKEYAQQKSYMYGSGLYKDQFGNWHGTSIQDVQSIHSDGIFDGEFVQLARESPVDKSPVSLNINPNQMVWLRDSEGKIHQGRFNVSQIFAPDQMYKDENDEILISGKMNISRMEPKTNLQAQTTGQTKGLAVFHPLGEEDMNLGGTYDIIIPQKTIEGSLRALYGDQLYNTYLVGALSLQTPKLKDNKSRVVYVTPEKAVKDFPTPWFSFEGNKYEANDVQRLQKEYDKKAKEEGKGIEYRFRPEDWGGEKVANNQSQDVVPDPMEYEFYNKKLGRWISADDILVNNKEQNKAGLIDFINKNPQAVRKVSK